jgi:hypothetical protein
MIEETSRVEKTNEDKIKHQTNSYSILKSTQKQQKIEVNKKIKKVIKYKLGHPQMLSW